MLKEEEAKTTQPIRNNGWKDGTSYALLAGASTGEVFLDEVRYYDPDEAVERCQRKDPLLPAGECSIHGELAQGEDLVRRVQVDSSADISYYDPVRDVVRIEPDDVEALLSREAFPYEIRVRGGKVVGMKELFPHLPVVQTSS